MHIRHAGEGMVINPRQDFVLVSCLLGIIHRDDLMWGSSRNKSQRGINVGSNKVQHCLRYKRNCWEDRSLQESSKYIQTRI